MTVASIAGVKGQAYTSAYCASKGGVVLFTKSLALELASRGVRVNCVCPGGVETPLIMGAIESMPADAERKLMARLDSVLPGLVHPDEVAEAIAYLASDAARMITGTTLLLDGGTHDRLASTLGSDRSVRCRSDSQLRHARTPGRVDADAGCDGPAERSA